MFYSQKSNVYGKEKLGLSNMTISQAGCLLCSLCSLDAIYHFGIGRTPIQMMDILMQAGAIDRQGMIDLVTAANALHLKYNVSNTKPSNLCVCETNAYASMGVKQHFFILRPSDSKIIDPLDDPELIDWKTKPAKYTIVSFRSLRYG